MKNRIPRQILPLLLAPLALLVELATLSHSATRGGVAPPDPVGPKAGGSESGASKSADQARQERIETLRKVIKRAGTPDSLRLELAREYQRAGTIEDRTQALVLFNTIRRTYNRDTRYYWELAILYEECQQPSRARTCLQELLEIDPHDVEARVESARLLLRELTYHFDLALTEPMLDVLRVALEDAPTHRDAAFLTSLALEMSVERPGKWSPAMSRRGQELLQGILTRNPDDGPARLFMAVHALDRGQIEEAARAFTTALEAGPADQRQAFYSARWTIPSNAPQPARESTAAELAAYDRREWRRMDPTPLTDRNENQLTLWKRLALADQLFGHPGRGMRGWDTAPGEAFVRYGEPVSHDFNPGEVWAGPNSTETLPKAVSGGAPPDAPIRLLPPSWNWNYRFRDVSFGLTFEDRSLNGVFLADNLTGRRLEVLRQSAPVVFQEAAPGRIRQIYLASAGVRTAGSKVHQGVYVGVPFWRKSLDRARLDKIKMEVVVRDSARTLVRQTLHYATADDVYALEPGLNLLLLSPQYDLSPGAYTITALVSDPEHEMSGVSSTLIEVNDYAARRELMVSDLELALNTAPAAPGPTVTKLGRTYVPNPLALAGADLTVDVFYEIYGLTAKEGVAQQQVRYTVLPRTYVLAYDRMVQEGRASAGDIVATAQEGRARGDEVLSGDNSLEVVFPPAAVPVADGRAPRATRVSLAGLAPGEYAFIVTVLDLTTNTSASTRTFLRVMNDAQRAALRAYAARE